MTSPDDAPPPYSLENPMQPPPLPPRQSESSLAAMASRDPRSASTQSLVPADAAEDTGRRRLLLIYLHGFQGNETSFRSFPAHLHNLVTITLADSHTVHTKVYPKYRSRYSLEVARDDFSKWLTPHETPWTDVILLGHSMGGLLAADIALLFRHNIIGLINFDVPFLGMHPGIVKAGLSSIFKPSPQPTDQIVEDVDERKPSRMDTLFNPRPSDPNYNPSFHNDVHLPARKGWENALHWFNKHSNGVIAASKGLVKSHIEFGSAMADYPVLKVRYAKIRALEEDDENKRRSANPEARYPPRIRFVNYYTASTGRPKKPKSPKATSPARPSSTSPTRAPEESTSLATNSQATTSTLESDASPATTPSPRVSLEEHSGDDVVPGSPEQPLSATEPVPMTDVESTEVSSKQDGPPDLPEIPPIPKEPPFVDIAQFSDKAERRAAEKEHSRALKEYQKAVKSRNAVIKERSKIEERWRKQKAKDAKAEDAKDRKELETRQESDTGALAEDLSSVQLGESHQNIRHNAVEGESSNSAAIEHSSPNATYDFSRDTILSQPTPPTNPGRSTTTDSTTTLTTLSTQDTNDSRPGLPTHPSTSTPQTSQPPKKQRYKKFCMLPPKDALDNKDPTWVRIFMTDMDEVTAHTSLFFESGSYELLVGDVAARVEEWVRESESVRVVREMGGG